MGPLEHGRGLAIVVGINEYPRGFRPLRNAQSDAQAVGELLRSQYGHDVLECLGKAATRDGLNALLREAQIRARAYSHVFFFFAGHGHTQLSPEGALEGYLIPSNGIHRRPSSFIKMPELRERLESLVRGGTAHLFVVLDCCNAGAFARTRTVPREPNPTLYLQRFERLMNRTSCQLLVSSAHNEETLDGDGAHSPFTSALLQALALSQGTMRADTNRDGVLLATELYTFISDCLDAQCLPGSPSYWTFGPHRGGEFMFVTDKPELPKAPPVRPEDNPYQGLNPYDAGRRKLFFGRKKQVQRLTELIQQPERSVTVISGESGTGKSSLLAAGVLPELQQRYPDWRFVSLRPGADPQRSLQEAMAAQPGALQRPTPSLDRWLAEHPSVTVLYIDQLEELVTQEEGHSSAGSFCREILGALERYPQRIKVVAAVRSGFARSLWESRWSDGGSTYSLTAWEQQVEPLPPMKREQLREVILGPAEMLTVFFDDALRGTNTLVDTLLDEMEGMPGALTLLSVALYRMFDLHAQSGREDRTITWEEYNTVKGVREALSEAADAVHKRPENVALEELPAWQDTLRRLMLRMVNNFDGERARRRVSWGELDSGEAEENARARRVLAALVTSKLVLPVSHDVWEPAHDALVSLWEPMKEWVEKEGTRLTFVRELAAAASTWQGHRQQLWTDDRILGLHTHARPPRRRFPETLLDFCKPQRVLDRWPKYGLSARERAFARKSLTARRNLRGGVVGGMALLAATVVLILGSIYLQGRRAMAQSLYESGRQQLLQLNPWQAAASLSAALELEDSPRVRFEVARALEGLKSRQQLLRGHQGPVNAAEFNPREDSVVTAGEDGTIRFWNPATGEALSEPVALQAPVRALAISPDGQWGAALAGERIAVIDLSTRRLRGPSFACTQPEMLLFNPRGDELAVVSRLGHVCRWSVPGFEAKPELASSLEPVAKQPVTSKQNERATYAHELIGALYDSTGEHLVGLGGYYSTLVRVWDGRDAKLPRRIVDDTGRSHTDAVYAAAFDATGGRLATAGEDHNTRVWNVATGKLERSWQGLGATYVVAFDQGDRVLSGNWDNTIKVSNARDGKTLQELRGHPAPVRFIRFNQDFSRLATASQDGTIRLWETENFTPLAVYDGHGGRITSLSFHPRGDRLLSSSTDGTAAIWAVHPLGAQRIWGDSVAHTGNVNSAKFTASGRYLVTSGTDARAVWIQLHPEKVCQLPPQVDPRLEVMNSVEVDEREELLVAASRDGNAYVWRVQDCELVAKLTHGGGQIHYARFWPRQSKIVTVGQDGTAKVWALDTLGRAPPVTLDPVTPEPRAPGEEPDFYYVAFSPDGRLMAVASHDGYAYLWNAALEPAGTLSGHSGKVYSAVFSSNGRWVVTASSDKTARLFDVTTQASVWPQLPTHTREVHFASFTPDDTGVLTVGGDGQTCLWRVRDGTQQRCFEGHTDEQFAQEVHSHSADLSADGARLVTTHWTRVARIWDVATGELLFELRGHSDNVYSAQFSRDPEGRFVVTGANDRTIRLWSTALETRPLRDVRQEIRSLVPWRAEQGRLVRSHLLNLEEQ